MYIKNFSIIIKNIGIFFKGLKRVVLTHLCKMTTYVKTAIDNVEIFLVTIFNESIVSIIILNLRNRQLGILNPEYTRKIF